MFEKAPADRGLASNLIEDKPNPEQEWLTDRLVRCSFMQCHMFSLLFDRKMASLS